MMDSPEAWQLWIIAGLMLCALEIKLAGFVMLWFGFGAFVAALVAALGVGLPTQLFSFTLVSIALFGASRTLFRRVFMRNAERMRQGVEAMVGAEAVVAEALPANGFGTVRVNGELWSARSLSGPVAIGDFVRIEQLDGLKLIVRRQAGPGLPPVSSKEGNP